MNRIYRNRRWRRSVRYLIKDHSEEENTLSLPRLLLNGEISFPFIDSALWQTASRFTNTLVLEERKKNNAAMTPCLVDPMTCAWEKNQLVGLCSIRQGFSSSLCSIDLQCREISLTDAGHEDDRRRSSYLFDQIACFYKEKQKYDDKPTVILTNICIFVLHVSTILFCGKQRRVRKNASSTSLLLDAKLIQNRPSQSYITHTHTLDQELFLDTRYTEEIALLFKGRWFHHKITIQSFLLRFGA